MRTCTHCKQIKPADSFYRGGAWCQECRAIKRKEYNNKRVPSTMAHRMLEKKKPAELDPTAYGKLHCEHIASYAKRAIERFELKTGWEAPPELTAIHQLASRLTDQQHAQLDNRGVLVRGSLVVETYEPRECEHCGTTYPPRNVNQRFCTPACYYKWRDFTQRRREFLLRYNQRKREREAPAIQARAEARQARAEQTKRKREARQAVRETEEQRWNQRARQAADMRQQGMGWQHIADTLGYGSPGAAFNAIHLRLHIDPRSLSAQPATT